MRNHDLDPHRASHAHLLIACIGLLGLLACGDDFGTDPGKDAAGQDAAVVDTVADGFVPDGGVLDGGGKDVDAVTDAANTDAAVDVEPDVDPDTAETDAETDADPDAAETDADPDTAETDGETCTPTDPPDEVCDGLDNDCDGETDEETCLDAMCVTGLCKGEDGCEFTGLTGPACDDGAPCSVGDTCTDGVCGGAVKDCDDNNPCTDDGCEMLTGDCTHKANTAACSDGDGCTVGDACKDAACLPGAATVCDDANPCTDDSCDKANGTCIFAANTAACSDGDGCTVGDACKDAACLPGAMTVCNDDNPCTDDSCDKASGKCAFTANTAPCSDGDGCTIGDACKDAACLPGAMTVCNDDNVCTDDSCDKASGECVFTANTAPCSDGDGCTVSDVCAGKACVAGKLTVCNDDNVCTDDSCDKASGECVFTANTAPCSDGDGCTLNDTCKDKACVPGAAKVCDDNNVCTDDGCDKASGACTAVANTAPCTDGDACTIGDGCAATVCLPGKATVCDDDNVCSDDSCDKASGKCVFLANAATCTDGNGCTVGDVCKDKACTAGGPKNCDDDNVCTADSCDSKTGSCAHAAVAGSCEDGNKCTLLDHCKAGTCVSVVKKVCDDGNACTDDSCDSKTGGCGFANNTEPCDDGTKCTAGTVCKDGACDASKAFVVKCDDNNPCTLDVCDHASGKCAKLPALFGASCGDGKVCLDDASCVDAVPCKAAEGTRASQQDGRLKSYNETNYGVLANADGSSFWVGITGDGALYNVNDAVIVLRDAGGTYKNSVTWGQSGSDEVFRDVISDGNGGALAFGWYRASGSVSTSSAVVLHVDASNKQLGVELHKPTNYDRFYAAARISATSIAAAGQANGGSTAWITLLDNDGKLVAGKSWTAVLKTGAPFVDVAYDAKNDKLLGLSSDQNRTHIALFDGALNPKGSWNFELDFGHRLNALTWLPDGRWAAVGQAKQIEGLATQGLLLVSDLELTKMVTTQIGGAHDDDLLDVALGSDGVLRAAGYSTDTFVHNDTQDGSLVRFTQDGAPLGQPRYYGGADADRFATLAELPKGGWLLGGSTIGPDDTPDRWYVVVDAYGNSSCGGGCKQHADCDDGAICTDDRCDAATGTCSHDSIIGCCAADVDCVLGDACSTTSCDANLHICKATPKKDCCVDDGDCDDGNACTTDSCQDAQLGGTCKHTSIAGCCLLDGQCDDGKATTNDACNANICLHQVAACTADADCVSDDACSVGKCDVEKKACTYAPKSCDDGNACTVDACGKDGACSYAPAAAGLSCAKSMLCDGEGICTQQACHAFSMTAPSVLDAGFSDVISDSDDGRDIAALPNGHLLTVGQTAEDKDNSAYDARVVEVDADGKFIGGWHYGEQGVNEAVRGVALRKDGGFWLAGESWSKKGKGAADGWLAHVGPDRKLVADTFHGADKSDEFNDVVSCDGLGAVAVGSIGMSSPMSRQNLIVSVDGAGKPLTGYPIVFGRAMVNDKLQAIACSKSPGRYVVVGESRTPAGADTGVAAIVEGGKLVTSALLLDWKMQAAADVVGLPLGGFAVVGVGPSTATSSTSATYLRISDALSVLAARQFSNPAEAFTGVAVAADGKRLGIFGKARSAVGKDRDAWLLHTTLDGEPLGSGKRFGSASDDDTWKIVAMPDGGFAFCGDTPGYKQPVNYSDMWIVRTTATGEQICLGAQPLCKDDIACDDGDGCTVDSCDLETGACKHEAKAQCCKADADCDDGKPCTADVCSDGSCSFATTPEGTVCDGSGLQCTATGGCGCDNVDYVIDPAKLDKPMSVIQFSYGGIGVDSTGATYTVANFITTTPEFGVLVVKRDAKGKKLWEKTFTSQAAPFEISAVSGSKSGVWFSGLWAESVGYLQHVDGDGNFGQGKIIITGEGTGPVSALATLADGTTISAMAAMGGLQKAVVVRRSAVGEPTSYAAKEMFSSKNIGIHAADVDPATGLTGFAGFRFADATANDGWIGIVDASGGVKQIATDAAGHDFYEGGAWANGTFIAAGFAPSNDGSIVQEAQLAAYDKDAKQLWSLRHAFGKNMQIRGAAYSGSIFGVVGTAQDVKTSKTGVVTMMFDASGKLQGEQRFELPQTGNQLLHLVATPGGFYAGGSKQLSAGAAPLPWLFGFDTKANQLCK
ncbi:MAG: hypothetical protein H6747_10730 [Deltaproteobacteria bacterium]|nr:hypothetical protein [Deltaproteobacteria bacterium]